MTLSTAWSSLTAPASAVTSTATSAGTSIASFIRDTFSAVSGTGLLEHVGEVGATWTRHPTASGSSIRITGNKSTYPIAGSWFVASGVPPGADYDIVATLTQLSVSPPTSADLIARSSSTNVDTRYGARYATTDNNWQMYKLVAGVVSVLTTVLVSLTTGSAYTMRFRVVGSGLTLYINDAPMIWATDAALTAAGSVGLAQGNIGSVSATSGLQFTNFGAESVVGSVVTSIVTTPVPIPAWTPSGAASATWTAGSQSSTSWTPLL